jgi:hypothetical protein
MTEESPVIVNPSPLASQARSALRAVILLGSGLGLSKFLPPDIATFIKSDEFFTAICAIGAIGAPAWAWFDAWLHKKQLVAAANAAPDSKFTVSK